MKRCTKCGGPGPFAKDAKRSDGLFPWCIECTRVANRARYAANPQKYQAMVAARKAADPAVVRARDRSYYQRNKVQHAVNGRRWVQNNPERRREVVREWHRTHKEYDRLKASARRARLRGLQVVPITEKDVAARVSVYGGRCAYCDHPYEHLDHVKPIKLNGPHILANLRPACGSCNRRKGSMPAMAWLRSLHVRQGGGPWGGAEALVDGRGARGAAWQGAL